MFKGKKVKVVAAIGLDGQIGTNRFTLPWAKIQEDMAYFKEVTLKGICIMGNRTFQSLPYAHRPLSERMNIILTTYPYSPDWTKDTFYVSSVMDALNITEVNGFRANSTVMSRAVSLSVDAVANKYLKHDNVDINIVGGSQVYTEMLTRDALLQYVDELLITKVPLRAGKNDTKLFPTIDPGIWNREKIKEMVIAPHTPSGYINPVNETMVGKVLEVYKYTKR